MKTLKTALLLAAVLCSSAGAQSADARGYRHHHHGARIGLFIGAPLIPFYYYYPRYYTAPVYSPYYPPAAMSSAPVYVEQNAPAAEAAAPAQGSTSYWYYCRDSQTYYPYVQQCASPWQQVVPQTPPPS